MSFPAPFLSPVALMPSRTLSLAIIAFWLATSAWLVYRDLWPSWRSGEPPPYAIDLVDEASPNAMPIRWSVFRDGTRIGRAYTRVLYRASDDTFELHGEMVNLKMLRGMMANIDVKSMTSMYRVTRDGELREVIGTIDGQGELLFPFHQQGTLQGSITGQVNGRLFEAQGRIESSLGSRDLKPEPIELTARASVLNPLHPVNRVTGLRPGQRWRMPVVDPMAAAMATLFPGVRTGPRNLNAQVLAEPDELPWINELVPCLVIEYRDADDPGADTWSARTWVRQSDGLVLRQEAQQQNLLPGQKGNVVAIQRDP
ncbi:MAG: hypothetical protein K2R98_29550 [Gemmataceae bacterium]|nr:hypothetical protein [Gemmataceae bacterium]